MKLSNLAPNAQNPRSASDAKLAMLKKSIATHGDLSGIIYNRKSKQLVGGHQRQKILDPDAVITYTKKYAKPTKTGTVAEGYIRLNGERHQYREVWWTPPQEKAANIAANKGAGDWDMEKLSEWMKDLSSFDADFDLDLTMFDSDELEQFEGITVKEHTRTGVTGVDEDEVPEQAPARSRLGDVYLLGQHRLMCGDSSDADTVSKLIEDETLDVIFTDPPYGINIVKAGFVSPRNAPSQLAKARQYKKVLNDDVPFDPSFILKMEAKTIILWGANHYASKLPDKPQWLVWDKKLESGSLDKNNFSDCELAWTNSKSLAARIYRHTWAGMLRKGDRKEELAVRVHPTQKPVGLCEDVLNDFSGQTVLDLFGGSGSTLIACEKTNRKCFMMELDPHYCDVIVTRWEKYTGKTAELVRPKINLKKTDKQPRISNG